MSQGYIVVGINHTYSSLVSVFPDGRVAQFESEGKEGFGLTTIQLHGQVK